MRSDSTMNGTGKTSSFLSMSPVTLQPIDRQARRPLCSPLGRETGDDDARLYVGTPTDDETEVEDQLKEAKLIPRTQHAVVGETVAPDTVASGDAPRNRHHRPDVSRSVRGKLRAEPGGPERPVAHRRRDQRGEQGTIDPRTDAGCPSSVRTRSSIPSPTISMPGWLAPWRT